jgi:hypothetical protein
MIALSLVLSLSLTSLPEKLPSQALYSAFRSWVEKTQGCNESAFFQGRIDTKCVCEAGRGKVICWPTSE